MALFNWQFPLLLCTILANGCAVLRVVVGSTFESECVQGMVGPGGSTVLQVTTAFLLFAVLAFIVFFLLMLKPRSKKGWSLVAAIFSKWQPSYFVIVSVQRVVLKVVAIPFVFNTPAPVHTCPLTISYENQIIAASLIWNAAILLAGVLAIMGDLDADLTPASRRCAYGLLALCLIVDMSGSYLFGNTARQASISIGSVDLLIDQQITSCISSQTLIAVHLLFVSARSSNGRAWAYAPLRFDLDEVGLSLLKLMDFALQSKHSSSPAISPVHATGLSAAAETSRRDLWDTTAAKPRMFFRMRQSFFYFQKRQIQRCRVFVIPCVEIHSEVGPVFELQRPLLKMGCPQLLQRLADAFPNYMGFVFFIFSSLAFLFARIWTGDSKQQHRGIATLACNCFIFIAIFGFCTSKRYNFDRVAAKHVVSSFRFVVCATLLLMFVALESRNAHLNRESPYEAASCTVLALVFCATALFDCSPQFPVPSQIFISVRLARIQGTACSQSILLTRSTFLQVGWCGILGYWTFVDGMRVVDREPDCFASIGVYAVCYSTESISIYVTLFLLMFQASMIRIFIPGMSIFVNESVGHFRKVMTRCCCFRRCLTSANGSQTIGSIQRRHCA